MPKVLLYTQNFDRVFFYLSVPWHDHHLLHLVNSAKLAMPHQQRQASIFTALLDRLGNLHGCSVISDTEIKISRRHTILGSISRNEWEGLLNLLDNQGVITGHTIHWQQDKSTYHLTVDCQILDKKILFTCTSAMPQLTQSDQLALSWSFRLAHWPQYQQFRQWLLSQSGDHQGIESISSWLQLIGDYEESSIEVRPGNILRVRCSNAFDAFEILANRDRLAGSKITRLEVYVGEMAYGVRAIPPTKMSVILPNQRSHMILTTETKIESSWVRQNRSIWDALPGITIVYKLDRDNGYPVLASKSEYPDRLNEHSRLGGKVANMPESIMVPRWRALELLQETWENQFLEWSHNWLDPLLKRQKTFHLMGSLAVTSDRTEAILFVSDPPDYEADQKLYFKMRQQMIG